MAPRDTRPVSRPRPQADSINGVAAANGGNTPETDFTDAPDSGPLPTEAGATLTIVTLATGCVSDGTRLRDLIDGIHNTGAKVLHVFPSVEMLTIESSAAQLSLIRELDDVIGLDFQPV